VITSFTVFIAALILFIFGGPVIAGFSFALMVGVAIGTYSSIFVATPLALEFQSKKELDSTTY
jgi:preprotein translocase subunit SecF